MRIKIGDRRKQRNCVLGSHPFELLERRMFLSSTGLTIITHGYSLTGDIPTWVGDMASEIRLKRGQGGSVISLSFENAPSAAVALAPNGETVVTYDWAKHSNDTTALLDAEPGWREGAGDYLATFLLGSHLAQAAVSAGVPIHFIAHSFGAVVDSEAIRRLGAYGIPVAQMTSLDPHDQNQFRIADAVNDPSVTTWSNVGFADAYWEDRSGSRNDPTDNDFVPNPVLPVGHPILGAVNRDLTDFVPYHVTSDFDNVGVVPIPALESPHSKIHEWYFQSILGNVEPGGYGENGDHWYYINSVLRPATSQGFTLAQPSNRLAYSTLGMDTTGSSQRSAIIPAESIFDGDFRFDPNSIQTLDQPGYSDNNDPWVGFGDSSHGNVAKLSQAYPGFTHNAIYFSPGAQFVDFDLNNGNYVAGTQLTLMLDGIAQPLLSLDLTNIPTGWIHEHIPLPVSVQNTWHSYSVSVVNSNLLNLLLTDVWVDNFTVVGDVSTPLPDLVPYQPSGWSDKIVVSTVFGTNTNALVIHSDQSIYIDFAVQNQGFTATSAQFHVNLLVDGFIVDTQYLNPPVDQLGYRIFKDFQLTPLTAGPHSISVNVDSLNQIPEAVETNNIYSRTITVVAQPTNDNFVDAKILTGPAATATGRNGNGTKEGGEPNYVGTAGGASIWYKWTGSTTGTVSLDTHGSDFDTVMAVFTGSSVSGLVSAATPNDDTSLTDNTSTIVLNAVAGTSYYISVDGWSGATGNVVLRLLQTGTSLPNLVPYTPPGWSEPVVISTITGTTTNAAVIYPTDTLYLNWALKNIGVGTAASQFRTKLTIDGSSVQWWYLNPPFTPQNTNMLTDYQLAPLSLGSHTITLEVDYTDYVIETLESDNIYTRTVVVVPAPPANDNFASAQPISGIVATANGTNVSASKEIGERNHFGNVGGASVWYKWTAPTSGTFSFDTHGSNFDTILAAYTGTAIGSLTAVPGGSNDDATGYRDGTSAMSFVASAGTTYFIAVDGYNDGISGIPATGSVTLNIMQLFPDLAYSTPTGWSKPVVLSTVLGSRTDTIIFHPNDTIYLDWAVQNAGNTPTTTVFHTQLLVDGVPITNWTSNPPFNQQTSRSITDYPLSSLTLGVHTIRIVTDYLNEIVESDETNNMYTKTITVVVQPTNDNFASAQLLSGTLDTANGTNIGATKETGEPSHAGNIGGASLWYKWTALKTGTTTFDTHGSTFDTLLAAYTGTVVGALTAVPGASNDDTSNGDITSAISFTAIAGTTYYIAVDGYNGSSGIPKMGSVTVHLQELFPDLKPTPPNAATTPLVVSTVTGTSTNASIIHASDPIFIDWAVINAGQAPTTAPFHSELLIDNQYVTSWNMPAGLGSQAAQGIMDYALGSLPAGQHTVSIVVDYLNEVAESNELNNNYTTTITVGTPTIVTFVNGANNVYVRRNADAIHADIWANSPTPGQGAPTQQSLISDVSAFAINGGIGDDTVTLDFSNGNPLPTGGLAFDGGPGVNTVAVIGTPGNDTLTASATGLTFTGSTFSNIPIITTNVQSLQFHGGSGGNDAINLTGGTYTIDADTPTGTPNVSVTVGPTAIANFATDQHLANLTINGGVANLSTTRHSMVVNALAISNNGLLDIANSFLYLNNTTTSFATVKTYLDAAYNLHGVGNLNAPYAGDYKGVTGITSSVAKASYATDEVVGIGYYDGALQDPANPDSVGQIYGPNSNSGHGAGIPLNQILIRPTLTGDLNGDGVVNSYDVGLFNTYGLFNTGPTALGWQAGDLNGDGVVDSKDVTIFNTVGNFNTGQYAVATAGARVASALSASAASSGGTANPAGVNQSRGVAAVAVAVQPGRSSKVAVNHHRSAQKHSSRSHVSRVFSALARLGRH